MQNIFENGYSLTDDINYALAHNIISYGHKHIAIAFNKENTKCRVGYISNHVGENNEIHFCNRESFNLKELNSYITLPYDLNTMEILNKLNSITDSTFKQAMNLVTMESIKIEKEDILEKRPTIEKINEAFRMSLQDIDFGFEDIDPEIFEHHSREKDMIASIALDISYALAYNLEDENNKIVILVNPENNNQIRLGHYKEGEDILHLSNGTDIKFPNNSKKLPSFHTEVLINCFKSIKDDLYKEVGKLLNYDEIYSMAQDIRTEKERIKPLSQKFKDAFDM